MPSAATRATAPAHYPTTLIDARWVGGAQRLLAALLQAQSATARRNRFHGAVNPSPALCLQMARVDHRRHLALVVSTVDAGQEQLVADARYCVSDDGRSADFALLVDERWQRHGVGAWALCALQRAAAAAGLDWLEGEVLRDNQAMLQLAQRCGFASAPDPHDERLVRVQHRLVASGARPAPPARPGLLRRLGQALAGRPPMLWRGPRPA